MAMKKVHQIESAGLRRLAEEQLRDNRGTAYPPGTEEEPLRLLHELQVHQIELEMQNEELRQARAEREEMEARLGKYSDIYDFAPVAYFNLDHRGIIRAVNITGTGFLGIARSLLIGRRMDCFISDETRPVFHDFLDKVFESETKETCEIVLQKERHSPLVVQVKAVLTESREECRAVVIDITERKRLLDQLQLTQFCVDKAAICIFRISEEGNIRFANELACLSLGYTPEELYSMTIFEIDPTFNVERFQDHRNTVCAKGLGTFETVHRRKDSSTFPVEITVNYHEYQGKGFTVSFARDITERKRAEEELQQALEAATSVNNTMRRLVRTVAHEFRTPLGLLTGSVDVLDRYWYRLTPEKRLEQNEHIRNAARQISDLVDSVTSFNQAGTDRAGNPLQILNIGDICRSIAAEVETVWCDGHEFIVSIAADCGTVLLDNILFRRILQNLLTNACRYTPTNGTVSLHVFREKEMLMLEITDTGIGIPEEDQALIFDPFYRSRNVEGQRGLGLGLSIVRDALSQMGGTITVTSSIGKGTAVRVKIPVVETM
jgi:PAS domain S-box-containing protein